MDFAETQPWKICTHVRAYWHFFGIYKKKEKNDSSLRRLGKFLSLKVYVTLKVLWFKEITLSSNDENLFILQDFFHLIIFEKLLLFSYFSVWTTIKDTKVFGKLAPCVKNSCREWLGKQVSHVLK